MDEHQVRLAYDLLPSPLSPSPHLSPYRYLPVYTPQIYWYRIMEGKVRLSEEEVEEVGRCIRMEEEGEEEEG